MERQIQVKVTGEFVQKDSKNAGVQGEANASGLHIVMSEDWKRFSKRIIWRNARGEKPVSVLLYRGVDALADGEDPLVFDTTIPAEPLALAGWCSFTIEGFRETDPSAVAVTVTDYLLVKPNDSYNTPKEPTPSQAQQLQWEIDSVAKEVAARLKQSNTELSLALNTLREWEVWDSEKVYRRAAKVSRLGSSYFCKKTCTGVDPAVDVADSETGRYWLRIAAKGDKGEQGPQGAAGERGPAGPRGIDGVAVETAGLVYFSVTEEGHLLCTYSGGEAPGYYINENGHLCLDL